MNSKWFLGVTAGVAAAAILGCFSVLFKHERDIAVLQTQMVQVLSDVNGKLDRLLQEKSR